MGFCHLAMRADDSGRRERFRHTSPSRWVSATCRCVRVPIGVPDTPATLRHPPMRSTPPDSTPMPYLPTLYKAKVPTKQTACAICLDRTRGKTQQVRLGYGITITLCSGHASVDFLTQRGGRDFVLTMSELWKAAGCLTTSRHKALDAHLRALRPRRTRHRPGSYAWPALRLQAERLFASGVGLAHVIARVRGAHYVNANPPSIRTIR